MPESAFDPARAAKLYRLFASAVHRRLQAQFPAADPQHIADAVVDAILALADTPGDVTEDAVYRSARNKAQTLARSEFRRKNWEIKVGMLVTEAAAAAPTVLEELAARELMRQCEDRLAHNPIARTPMEQRVLDLVLNGTADPAELAAATGLSAADAETVYARLRKRMSRERKLVATEAS